jgi:hypothetical protein
MNNGGNMQKVSKKLLQAVTEVGGKVQKTGYNSFSKYHYITESDINEAVLPALTKAGLVLTTSVVSVKETPSSEGQKNRFAEVILVHKVIDSDSGECLEFQSAGTGADTLDKAVYKAVTGACKYFMMKLFMISGDTSDPENDGAATPPPAQAKGFGKKPEAAPAAAPAQEKKGFMAKKTEAAAAPAAQPAKTEKKPSFGAKKAPAAPAPEQETVDVEHSEVQTEEDAAY